MKVKVIYPPITRIDAPSLTGLYISQVLERSGIDAQYIDLNGFFYKEFFSSSKPLQDTLQQYNRGEINTLIKWSRFKWLLSYNEKAFYEANKIKIYEFGKIVQLDGVEWHTYMDAFIEKYFLDEISGTDVICLQIYSNVQFEISKRIIPIIKKENSHVKIIVGGQYLNLQKEQLDEDVIYCKSVVEILKILGCTISKENLLLRHDYKYSMGFRDYYIQSGVFPIMFNATCSYSQCKFCYNGQKINEIKPKNINQLGTEIKYIIDNYGATKFRFWDECLFPKDILAFTRLINENNFNIQWYTCTRFSSILKDYNIVKHICRGGCVGLFLGLECADNSALIKMGKGIRVALIYDVLKCLKTNGIKTHISLLYGFPEITDEEYMNSKEFICKNIDLIDFIDVNWLFKTSYNNLKPDMRAIRWYEDMKKMVHTYGKQPCSWKYTQIWK